ncbi:MAG: FKBP-type peptidyl-prolyl cis-trans isomerase, partial [Bacteroidota bacterium]
ILIFLISCQERTPKRAIDLPTEGEIGKAIFEVNKYILKRNRDHIEGFVRRAAWDMKKTGSGLWYQLENSGSGSQIREGDYIRMDYEMYLIDGTFISSSENDGVLEFTVGQGGVESGLEEAVMLFKEGTRAKLILPPHLAYGNFGNPEIGIPPDAILFYKLKVLDLQSR